MESSSESEDEINEKPDSANRKSETLSFTKAIKAKNVIKKKTKSGKKEKKKKRTRYNKEE